jgi:putative membrane protein
MLREGGDMVDLFSFAAALPLAEYGHRRGGSWLWVIPAALVFAALIAALVYLVRSAALRPVPPMRPPTAIEILDRRFAEGEISAEEYRARRDALSSAHE